MSQTNNFNFFKFYSTDFSIIRIFGGYIVEEESTNRKFWVIYLVLSNILFPLIVNMAQIFHLFELTSLIKLVSSGYIIAICCMGSIKSFFIFRNRKEFLKLIIVLKYEKLLPTNLDQYIIVGNALNLYTGIKYILVTICTMSAMASMITPLFNYRERRLPFDAWYPFDLAPAPVYAFVYIHQCISDSFITYMNVYTDILVAAFTTFTGIQCDILCYNLSHLRENDIEEGLRKCIEHHKLILR